jgi:4-hydroxy-2-oxoheptanedioate aldolase
VNAFNPSTARGYMAAGAAFVLVGADVSILARGSEALAADFIPPDAVAEPGGTPASY